MVIVAVNLGLIATIVVIINCKPVNHLSQLPAETVVLTPCYLPPLSWWVTAASGKACLLETHAHYRKGSYRNRTQVTGPQGMVSLSIPLSQGKHQQLPLLDVAIFYGYDWVKNHWHTFQSAYGRSPFFSYYADDLYSILQQRPATLYALQLQLLQQCCRWMQWDITWQETTAYHDPLPEIWLDARDWAQVTPMMPGAIREVLPEYHQVFSDKHGFLPDLSILDMLCNVGPEAGWRLQQAASKLWNS